MRVASLVAFALTAGAAALVMGSWPTSMNPNAAADTTASSDAGADSVSQSTSAADTAARSATGSDSTSVSKAGSDSVSKNAPATRPRGDAAAGKKIFKEKCIACHKADGSGGIKLTGNPTPDWRNSKRMSDPKYDDAYLRDCITNGKPKSGMVAWSKQGVKPAAIENLIAYIRTFSANPKK